MVNGHCLAILISLVIATSTTAIAQGGYSVSADGLNFIAEHEGIEYNLYNDPAGHCTIGIGHLVHKGNCDGTDPSEQEFLEGITKDQAQELLRADVAIAEQDVNSQVTVPLTQAQFDALVSFAYNLGGSNLATMLRDSGLNEGNYDAVPTELNRYVYGGGEVLPGLVTRRSDEGTLFQSEGNPEAVSPSYQGSNTLGERVVTTQGLHVRSDPGTSSNVITTEAAGTTGTITSGPIFQDDYWWWQVSFDDGTIGWSAENWLGLA
jgi:lysozyme